MPHNPDPQYDIDKADEFLKEFNNLCEKYQVENHILMDLSVTVLVDCLKNEDRDTIIHDLDEFMTLAKNALLQVN